MGKKSDGIVMTSMSEIHALVTQLIECEAEISKFGWGTIASLRFELQWEEAHAELNRFFSPLEIRRLIGEVSNES